jgi:hypothetical protein
LAITGRRSGACSRSAVIWDQSTNSRDAIRNPTPHCSGARSRSISASATAGARLKRICCFRSDCPTTARPAPMPRRRPSRHRHRHVRAGRDRRRMSDRSREADFSSGVEQRNAGLPHASRSRAVDAAPASVAPWQIPARTRRRDERHIVDAGCAPRLAAQDPRQRHPSAAPQAEAFDRFVAIHRTCRQVPAVVADQRRQRVPVDPDQCAPRVARQTTGRAGTIRALFSR